MPEILPFPLIYVLYVLAMIIAALIAMWWFGAKPKSVRTMKGAQALLKEFEAKRSAGKEITAADRKRLKDAIWAMQNQLAVEKPEVRVHIKKVLDALRELEKK